MSTMKSELIIAKARRLLLAGYLDLLILMVPTGLFIWGLSHMLESLFAYSFLASLVLFFIVEIILLKYISWSPGNWLLGIRILKPSAVDGSMQNALAGRIFVVDPCVFYTERWWSVLLGVSCVLGGAKELVRWTQFIAPTALFGITLDGTVPHPVVWTQDKAHAAALSRAA